MSQPEKDKNAGKEKDGDDNSAVEVPAITTNVSGLKGIERAAILLLTLGEEEAAGVMKFMEPKEVQKIGLQMAALRNITKQQVVDVLKEFYSIVETATALGLDADEYIRNVLVKALGEDKASGLIDRILLGGHIKGLEAFKWMEPRAIAELIRNEHPQIIAIVLSFLEYEQGAQVLSMFAEQVRVDVILRIATLEGIQPAALQELNDIMERQYAGNTNVKSSSIGGVRAAANILNFMDSTVESEIMDGVKEIDHELAEQIEDLMFVFENLLEIDDKGIQALLREISSETLIIALKGADENIKAKIFRNMSKRAGDMLREDLEAKGPVRLSEVEQAQREIVSIARRMAESGDIVLAGKGDEFV